MLTFCREGQALSHQLVGKACSTVLSAWMVMIEDNCVPSRSLCNPSRLGKAIQGHPRCDSIDPSNAFLGILGDYSTSQRVCIRLTRYRWTLCILYYSTWFPTFNFIKLKLLRYLKSLTGARYHRVATYSVRKPVWSCSGSATRAKPKSQIYLNNFMIIKNS